MANLLRALVWLGGCGRNVFGAKNPFQHLESPEGKEAEDEKAFKGLGSPILTLKIIYLS